MRTFEGYRMRTRGSAGESSSGNCAEETLAGTLMGRQEKRNYARWRPTLSTLVVSGRYRWFSGLGSHSHCGEVAPLARILLVEPNTKLRLTFTAVLSRAAEVEAHAN